MNILQKMAPKHTFPSTPDVISMVPFESTAGSSTGRYTFGNPLILILWFSKAGVESAPSSKVRHWSAKKKNLKVLKLSSSQNMYQTNASLILQNTKRDSNRKAWCSIYT